VQKETKERERDLKTRDDKTHRIIIISIFSSAAAFPSLLLRFVKKVPKLFVVVVVVVVWAKGGGLKKCLEKSVLFVLQISTHKKSLVTRATRRKKNQFQFPNCCPRSVRRRGGGFRGFTSPW